MRTANHPIHGKNRLGGPILVPGGIRPARAWRAGVVAALALACASSAGPPVVRAGEVDPGLAARAGEILSQAIQLRTVNPPGDERPLAEYLVELLRGAGLDAAVVETPPGASDVGRAAAWGRLPGNGDRPPLVLLSHLDVVPAESDAWDVDPFAGVVRGGFAIGRGALDAKGVATLHLLALVELRRRGIELERDVVFLATPDEETGGLEGAGHLVRTRPDLFEGAGYVLTEGGGILEDPDAGSQVWSVAVTEKSPCWLRLVARGAPGHGSVPLRDAAVPRLLDALERVRLLEPEVRVVPDVAAMFAALAERAPPDDTGAYADLGRALEVDTAFRHRFLAEPRYAALVRNTLAITVLFAGGRTNVLPAEARAEIDMRLLPGESCTDASDAIRRAIGDPGVAVEEMLSFPTSRSSVATPLFEAIRRVGGADGALVVPSVVAGFTDAHWFREVGIAAYGFVPRRHRRGVPLGIHGPNERASLRDLARGVETLIAVLQTLDRAEE